MYQKMRSMVAIPILIFAFLQALSLSVWAAPPSSSESASESPVMAEPVVNSLMGFQDWKEKRVVAAKKSLHEFKAPLKVDEPGSQASSKNVENHEENPGELGKTVQENLNKKKIPSEALVDDFAEEIEAESGKSTSLVDTKARGEKLRQLEFNLEIAQGLTVHDYFALYLKDKSKLEMAQAIKKLTPDELSELLVAYRSSLYGLPKAGSEEPKPQQKSL